MKKEFTDSDIKELVERGDPSFIRTFDCLYLDVRAPYKAVWYFRFQSRGKRVQMKLGVYGDSDRGLMSLGDAIKQAIDLKVQTLNGNNPKLDRARLKHCAVKTVDELADLYLQAKSQRIKTTHILERLYRKEIQPHIGHERLDKVHPLDVYELVQAVLRSGRPSIANKTLHLCKNIFSLGVKNGLLSMNPAASYNAVEDAGGNMPARDVVLREEEIEIMFDVFREHPKKVPEATYIGFALLLIFGFRKMELFAAQWINVDLKRKYFHLCETKTNKSLAVPIPDDVLPLFKRLKELSAGSEYLFPARRRKSKRGHISNDTVNHTLADLFGKVISKRQPGQNVLGQAGVTDFVIHDLRRTCRTLMAGLGIREEVAEKCLNHSFKNLVGVYNRYEYKDERKDAHEKVARLILPLAGYKVSGQDFKKLLNLGEL